MSDTLEIIVRAIDEASSVIKGITSAANQLGGQLEDVDVQDPTINVVDDQLQEALREVERLEDALDQAHFDGDDIEADIIADELAEATAKAEELQAQLDDININIDVDGEEEIDVVDEKIEDVDDTISVDVNVDGDEQVDTVDEKVENVDNKPINIPVNVDGEEQIDAVGGLIDGITGKIVGLGGAIALADQATQLWEASTSRQTQSFYLGANMGVAEAQKMQKVIQGIVASVPGDDTFMNQLMTTALAQNTSMTTSELEKMATVAADYMAGSKMMGKQNLESQQDIYKYLLDGNTAELERGSILSSQVDKLKDQATIQDRIKAASEALHDMSYEGISGYDTAANKMEEFQGRLEKARADLGEMFLPAIQGALEFGLALDDSVGGGLMAVITAAAAGIPAVVTGLSAVGESARGIQALSDAYRKLSISESILNAIEGEGAVARIAAALGITTEAAAAEGATVAFWGLAIAEGAMLWPILAIVAAIALLVAALYEVGKAFGWWKDVGTMLEAIGAGAQRLWSAFINHPDVQAAITVISDALTALWNSITKAGAALLEFFGISVSGDFDVVHALIMAIGNAWNFIREPIVAVIEIIQTFNEVIYGVISGNMDMETAIYTIWNSLVANLPVILNAILTIWTTIWGNLALAIVNLSAQLVMGVFNWFSKLPGRIYTYLARVLTYIISVGARWVAQAKAKASQIVTGVIAYLQGLPGKAYTWLYAVVGKITSAGAQWASNAKTAANGVVTAVKNKISKLPGEIYDEFKKIGDKILQTSSYLASAARKAAQAMVKAFLDASERHSPGIIQRSAVAEFTESIDRINQQVGPAGKVSARFGHALVDGFNGAALDLATGKSFDISNGSYIVSEENLQVDLNHNHDFTFNFENVPDHINTDDLKKLLTNRDVIKAMVSSNDFQDLDNKIKNRRTLRNRRANGGTI